MPAGARSSPSGSPAPAHAVTSPAGTREHLTRDESRASAAGRPPASQPEPRQPDASQPEPSQPAASQPEPSQPAASQPEPSQPDASKREPSQPDASQPEPSQPHASQPQPSKREPSQPDAGRPDALRLTAPAGPAQATADSQIAGKATADGKLLYRRLTPVVMWWAWLAFAVFCLVDVVIPAHSYLSIEVVAGLLAITAAVYACTLRPRVIADDESVVIHNPFREHRVGWGAVRGVFLGDSVEFTCARPAPKKDKTIYCWALYGGRRPKMRAQMQRSLLKMGRSARTFDESAAPQRKDPVQLMAAELGRRCKDARERGVPDAVLESRWAWLPLAGTLVLVAVALVLVLV